MKPEKKKSVERIDGAVAAIVATHCMLLANGDAQSVYEGRGLRVL